MGTTLVQVMGVGFLGVLIFAIGCGESASHESLQSEYSRPVVAGRIEAPDIKESSGLSASECQDVLWTHNDAGNGPLLFGMDLQGKHLGTWKVQHARNVDWESIATVKEAGKCFLIIGDIGDNAENRSELEIYKVAEPAVSVETARSNSTNPLLTEPAQMMKFSYPDGSNNAETILVHPRT